MTRKGLDEHAASSESEESDSERSSGSSSPAQTFDLVKKSNTEANPTFAQYIDSDEASDDESDEDDVGQREASSSSNESLDDGVLHQEDTLRKKLGSIPLSSLVRARKQIAKQDDSEDMSDSEEDEFEQVRNESAKSEERKRIQQQLEKRGNKHAPTEMSSRKPVSRRRIVVESAMTGGNIQRRDPRFSSLSASLPNAGLFKTSYGFLREQQSSEVAELKSVFNKLKKQESNHAGAKAKSELALSIRAEREKVERALKRAEGQENERRKRERENAVIQGEKKAIQERVKKGGKFYHLKDSAKKELILKDKFEKLSGSTNNGSNNDEGSSSRKELKRAIERRRKKNAAKERRDLPVVSGSADFVGIPKRKRIVAQGESTKRKRGRRG